MAEPTLFHVKQLAEYCWASSYKEDVEEAWEYILSTIQIHPDYRIIAKALVYEVFDHCDALNKGVAIATIDNGRMNVMMKEKG